MKYLLIVAHLYFILTPSTIVVTAGGDLQAAINSAQCGDTVSIAPNTPFTGNFKIPDKQCVSSNLTIRTSATLPLRRIGPADKALLARLVSPNSLPALSNQGATGRVNLIGLEITNIGGSVVTEELVTFGGSRVAGTQPHNLLFDRCWIHEATNDTTTPDSIITTAIRGMSMNAADWKVTRSTVAGFRAYRLGGTQVEASNGILLASNNLRFEISDSYIEAWFVPIFFGGSAGESPNTATLSNASYSNGTGTATFSSISNLSVGNLIALQVAGGKTPPTNSAHPNEGVVYQVAQVTGIAGNVVSFKQWGTYDGNPAGGNPLLQAPCACGGQDLGSGYVSSNIQAQWNGYLNQSGVIKRNDPSQLRLSAAVTLVSQHPRL